MNKKQITLDQMIVGRNFHISNCFEENRKQFIQVVPNEKTCICPQCGRKSSTIVSSYERTIQDVPIGGMPTYQIVLIYKYRCLNPDCSKKIFSEPFSMAATNQVRTHALNFMILDFSIFLSSSSSSKIFSNIGVTVSPDTIQRFYGKIKYYDDSNVEGVGIDDVSLQKGKHYNTVIYDMKDGHFLTLLEGRNGKSLEPWLKNHKKIKVVARDRDSSLAKAVTEANPNCEQVSDRFLLIQSLITYLDNVFNKKIPKEFFIKDGTVLDKAPRKVSHNNWHLSTNEQKQLQKLHYDNTRPLDKTGKTIDFDAEWGYSNSLRLRRNLTKRLKRKKRVEEIRSKFKSENIGIMAFSKKYQINTITLHKYLTMSQEEVSKLDKRKVQRGKKSVISNYINIIFKMIRDGYDDRMIFSYVISKGYEHSSDSLWGYIDSVSKNNFPGRAGESVHYSVGKITYPKGVIVISRKELLKSIFENSHGNNRDVEDLIQSKYPIIGEASQIYKDFHNAIMGTDVDSLNKFLDKYSDDTIVSGFCERIKKDIASTRRAISLDINSGFVEGNNTKLKYMERIVYYKCSTPNFSKKCYLAFLITTPNFDLKDIFNC